MEPEGYYCIFNGPLPVPILSQINPVHAPPIPVPEDPFNFILPSLPGSSNWALSLVSQSKPCIHLSSPPLILHAHPFILLDLITQIILGEEDKSLSSLYSCLHSPVTSSLLGPNILLTTLFSNTLSLRFSLNVSYHVSHPYKTPDKIIVLCNVIFKFLDSKVEDKRFCTEW